MGVIGILTCEILEKEFAYLFANDRDISRISVIEDAKSDELIKLLLAQGDNRLERLVHLQSFSPEPDSKPEILIRVLELALHNRKQILQEGLIQAAKEMWS